MGSKAVLKDFVDITHYPTEVGWCIMGLPEVLPKQREKCVQCAVRVYRSARTLGWHLLSVACATLYLALQVCFICSGRGIADTMFSVQKFSCS